MSRDPASSSNGGLYSILGVDKTCSSSEIRAAYRKLAMKWHPDKCPASDVQAVNLAKSKFQDIHDAYSVLSDESRRFLYDSGLYNEHDDEGMQDFMGEMANMMSACSSKSTFGELQEMLNQMVDSYLPDDLRAPSSNTSFDASFSGSSQPLFGKQSFCIGVESCSNQSFCIGDHESMARQKVPRRPQKRRKCPYNQGPP